MSTPSEPQPYTLNFENNESAFEALVDFEFKRDYPNTPQLEGWIILRVDEPMRLVQARLCAPFIGYRSMTFDEWSGNDGQERNCPKCWLEKRKTLSDWQTSFPDSLIAEVQHSLSREYLQRILEGAPDYFIDLKILRAKEIPWSQQDFWDAEACLAGVATYKPSWRVQLYGRHHLEQAARNGRDTEDVVTAQRQIRSLQNLAYQAAEAFLDRSHQSRRKDFFATRTYEQEDEAWLKRLRLECPGFSDWVYQAAIHDWGFHAAR